MLVVWAHSCLTFVFWAIVLVLLVQSLRVRLTFVLAIVFCTVRCNRSLFATICIWYLCFFFLAVVGTLLVQSLFVSLVLGTFAFCGCLCTFGTIAL